MAKKKTQARRKISSTTTNTINVPETVEQTLIDQGEKLVTKIVTIDLSPQLNISNASELHAEFLQYRKGVEKIVINAEKLEFIDTACMQVLLSFMNYFKNESVTVDWQNVPVALHEAAGILGLKQHISLP